MQISHRAQLLGELGIAGVERECGARITSVQVDSGRVVGRDAGVQVTQNRIPVGQLVVAAALEAEVVAEQEVDDRAHLAGHVVPCPPGKAHNGVVGAITPPVVDADCRLSA